MDIAKMNTQELRTYLGGIMKDEPGKTLDQFNAVIADYEPGSFNATGKFELALHAVWWFVENVGQDDPDRTDIFFKCRELVRKAWEP